MRLAHHQRFLISIFFLLLSLRLLLAEEAPPAAPVSSPTPENQVLSYSLHLPVEGLVSAPAWLKINPPSPDAPLASQAFQIIPPAAGGDLAVTFFFNENDGGFLRVIWQSAHHSQMLCDNLYEGVGMPNRRTLLIDHQLLDEPGTLELQSSSTLLEVSQIEWNWTTPAVVLKAAGATTPALALEGGRYFAKEEVDGTPTLTAGDAAQGQIMTAFLNGQPERLENGIEISSQITEEPRWARMEARFLGLGFKQVVQLWINNQKVGNFSLLMPDATDSGYENNPVTGTPDYIGWRTGTLFIPAGFLRAGENVFDFTTNITGIGQAPLAIKEIKVQLDYTPSTVKMPALAKVDASALTPSGTETTVIETAATVAH